jgi:hypothetical protein
MASRRKHKLEGRTIGSWEVIEFLGSPFYLCKCLKCGCLKRVRTQSLTEGTSNQCQSCERQQPTKHGHARANQSTATYNSWMAMRHRCLNPNDPFYSDYGGRGIKICARWNDFAAFLADMGERPKGKTLHRKKTDGDYEPSNCVWATPSEQQQQRRDNRLVKLNGELLCVSVAADKSGRKRHDLYNFLNRRGWPDIDISILPNPIPKGYLPCVRAS